jgi:hypothetical protein
MTTTENSFAYYCEPNGVLHPDDWLRGLFLYEQEVYVGLGSIDDLERVGVTITRGAHHAHVVLDPEELRALIDYLTYHLDGMIHDAETTP